METGSQNIVPISPDTLPKVGVGLGPWYTAPFDLGLVIQVEGNRPIDLGALQRREVFPDGLRGLPFVERVHHGIQRNARPGHVAAPVALFDVFADGLAPVSHYTGPR